ncbi:MAG: response regulator transcription factor [Caldilineaceae bacterium]|nr:response regulator transcription factor [Caldilineaceae bacterium]
MEVVGEASKWRLKAWMLPWRSALTWVAADVLMPVMDAWRRHGASAGNVRPQVLILTVHAQKKYLPCSRRGAAICSEIDGDTNRFDAICTVRAARLFLYPSATRLLLEDYISQINSGSSPDEYEGLSEREREVLKLIALGYTAAQVGEKLSISPKTVETYRARIMEKLNLSSRPDLVQYALSRGLLSEYT